MKYLSLVLMLFVTTAVGCFDSPTKTTAGLVGDFQFWSKWESPSGNRQARFLNMVLIPAGQSIQVTPSAKESRPAGIYWVGDNLFIDGREVEVTNTARVFVLTVRHKLEPVSLTREQLRSISDRGTMEAFDETEVWQSVIEPEANRILAGAVAVQVAAPDKSQP